jgi:HSP20 family protein
MATVFADPFDALLQFQQALDSFRTSGWLSAGPSARGAYPPINIFRKGDDLVAIAEVPGIQKSNLEIQVVGRTIRIAGSKAVEYGEKAALHRRERLAGRFDRAFTVPVEIDADRVKAESRDGILALYLPRAVRDTPTTIAVG